MFGRDIVQCYKNIADFSQKESATIFTGCLAVTPETTIIFIQIGAET